MSEHLVNLDFTKPLPVDWAAGAFTRNHNFVNVQWVELRGWQRIKAILTGKPTGYVCLA